jgi:F420-0:Gamma-glutamyl ligase.
MRFTGTVSRGIRAPIIKQGDDLIGIVVDSVLAAAEGEGFSFHDRDVVAMTEAIVARSQGNYASTAQIAADVRAKTGGGTVGIIFPILSRNRFSMLLEGISGGCEKLVIQLSYPADEVGNQLISIDTMDEKGVNPYTDSFTEEEFRAIFGNETVHKFTGVDYISYYKSLGANVEIIFSNDARHILTRTDTVICCDIHSRRRSKRILKAAGVKTVLGLDELLTECVDGSGYNPQYGLLGSNKATGEQVKLFPRNCQPYVDGIAARLREKTGKQIEVMVYGDGAFKDPVGGIWELADPVVSPAYTPGLAGTPNELKLKYLADNDFGNLKGEELAEAIRQSIRDKESDLVGNMASEGTTPRQLTDLLGSLCDLTSGSGDKGTPIILIQGYFDTYAD